MILKKIAIRNGVIIDRAAMAAAMIINMAAIFTVAGVRSLRYVMEFMHLDIV